MTSTVRILFLGVFGLTLTINVIVTKFCNLSSGGHKVVLVSIMLPALLGKKGSLVGDNCLEQQMGPNTKNVNIFVTVPGYTLAENMDHPLTLTPY